MGYKVGDRVRYKHGSIKEGTIQHAFDAHYVISGFNLLLIPEKAIIEKIGELPSKTFHKGNPGEPQINEHNHEDN